MAREPLVDLRDVERDCDFWVGSNPAGSHLHQHARSVKRIIAALRALQSSVRGRRLLRKHHITDSAPQEADE